MALFWLLDFKVSELFRISCFGFKYPSFLISNSFGLIVAQLLARPWRKSLTFYPHCH